MDTRYWDASAFIAILNQEEDRVQQCAAVLNEADRGRIVIATSAVTLTEVVKMRGERPLGRDRAEDIRRFFMHEYISLRDADRAICELAQDLIWDHHRLGYKDAIHIATALRWQIPRLDTFDDDHLIPLDGQIGEPPLRIGYPSIPQGSLPLNGGNHEEDEE